MTAVMLRIIGQSHAALVVLAFCALGVSGAHAQRSLKDTLLSSPAVRLVELLYDKSPSDTQAHSRIETMTVQDLTRLEGILRDMGNLLIKAYGRHRPAIGSAIQSKVSRASPSLRVVVYVDHAGPLLNCIPSCDSTSEELTVNFSASTIDGLLRGGLSAAHKAPTTLKPLFDSSKDSRTVTVPDLELVGRYLRLIWELRSADIKRLGPLQASLLVLGMQQIEGQVLGVLLFALSHELGHFVMNHHCMPISCEHDQPAFEEMELEADAIAAALTSSVLLRDIPNAGFQDDLDGSLSFIGSATFLSQGYERIFRTNLPSSCPSFVYPSAQQRGSAANHAVYQIVLDKQALETTDGKQALQMRIEEIRRKYQKRQK